MLFNTCKLAITTLLISIFGVTSTLAQQRAEDKNQATEYHHKKESAKRAHKGWKLVWADEFSGNKIDTNSWRRCHRYGSPWNRHMSMLDSLCQVKNGVVQLYGINKPEKYQDSLNFLTGGLESRGMRFIRNGRIDVRARFDCAQGFWPAIWLMPESELPWPEAGEIDIMEHLNFDSYIYQTVHSGHIEGLRQPKTQHDHKEPVDLSCYNVYSVEITDSEIIYYINNRRTFTYSRLSPEPEGQYPFDDYDYYMILSAQLGGHWIGPIEADQLPVKMEVDYVRFYLPKSNKVNK
ncbi:MAG: glycoside hydrolase family 16 protein [Alistipes sp.]|nr:glycoside hydrolase family 16 protein [Alistipes sp.]